MLVAERELVESPSTLPSRLIHTCLFCASSLSFSSSCCFPSVFSWLFSPAMQPPPFRRFVHPLYAPIPRDSVFSRVGKLCSRPHVPRPRERASPGPGCYLPRKIPIFRKPLAILRFSPVVPPPLDASRVRYNNNNNNVKFFQNVHIGASSFTPPPTMNAWNNRGWRKSVSLDYTIPKSPLRTL